MNQDKIISVRKRQYNHNISQKIYSSPKDKEEDSNTKMVSDNKCANSIEIKDKSESRNKYTRNNFSEGKRKNYFSLYHNNTNKTNKFPIKLERKNIKDLEVEDNDDIWKQYSNIKNSQDPPKSRYEKHKNNSQIVMSNYSINNFISNNFHNNIDSSIVSNNNNVILIDNNNSTYTERLNPKNAIRINKIKDDYIDFLQKQYEDHSKINYSLDSSNKELLKKCDELIQDNLALNKALHECTEKLNTTLQENTFIKAQLDKIILNNNKNQQKLGCYEEQFNLFKNNNDNYQKIIEELKQQNYQLKVNLNNIKDLHEEEQKKLEEKYKKKIEEIKKDMENLNNNNKENKNKKEIKIKDLMEEIKKLKDKNNELTKELQKKENIIELMYKDNEKLANQNNLKNIEIEQSTKQIENLNVLIQHKENLINSLKFKGEEKEKKLNLNKSNSPSSLKLENSEYINITKLINDNEENKAKIDYLNDKLKSIKDIEKKYNELIDRKTISSSDKSSFICQSTINSNIISNSNNGRKNGHPIYFSKNIKPYNNKTFNINIAVKENRLNTYKQNLNSSRNQNSNANKTNTIGLFYLKKEALDQISTINFEDNSDTYRSSSLKMKQVKAVKINESNDNKETIDNKNNTISIRVKKNSSISDIEKSKRHTFREKKEKSEILNNKAVTFRGRNYYKRYENKNSSLIEKDNEKQENKNTIEEKNEIKESIQKMNKYITLDLNIYNRKLIDVKKNIEIFNDTGKRKNSISYYLYGIDRNDFLHIFDITNKRWIEKKKIYDINLDDKTNSFKKDYQYEGTLLYNILEGVYILTGEKIDILYYFNSTTNTISKICRFHYCHDNGSMMYDPNSKCIYVFGGKHTTSCEYYSLTNKKIYQLPDLNTDRANASYIISNNKIFAFFGFSYEKDAYVKTIEYIDYTKKDKWIVLNNMKLLNSDIPFDIESVSTIYYKQDNNKIMLYCGIRGEDEEFITEYYLVYDAKKNTMSKNKHWKINHYKNYGNIWKEYTLKHNDPKGFHFAKNSRFILLPKYYVSEGYSNNDIIDIMIDYKNNVHYILQDKEKIDIYRGEL